MFKSRDYKGWHAIEIVMPPMFIEGDNDKKLVDAWTSAPVLATPNGEHGANSFEGIAEYLESSLAPESNVIF